MYAKVQAACFGNVWGQALDQARKADHGRDEGRHGNMRRQIQMQLSVGTYYDDEEMDPMVSQLKVILMEILITFKKSTLMR